MRSRFAPLVRAGVIHCTVLLALAGIAPAALAQAPAQPETPAPGSAAFTIAAHGVQIGREEITLSKDATGWLITTSGRIGDPIDLTINRFELHYTTDWQPIELNLDAFLQKSAVSLKTSFSMTNAINEITQVGRTVSKTDQVSARTVVLPNGYYGAYEALAVRLTGTAAGATIPVYVAPQGEIAAAVKSITPQTLRGPEGEIATRRYALSIPDKGTPIDVDVTVDAHARLVRIDVPSSGLTIVRDDAASVAMRATTTRNPTDADVSIPANGFTLAATITPPSTVAGRLRYPVVVLIAPTSLDRDATMSGVPVFAGLAKTLADRGVIAVRYDNRGIGQSGGRTDSATLADYADDAVSVVKWAERQKDADDRHVIVCGYGEGAAIAMLAAARTKDIDGVVALEMPGGTGAEALLEQQQRVLATLTLTDAEKQSRIALQKKIQNAVLTGRGWEDVPEAMRRQADTPLFRSQLAFDPAEVLPKLRQPLLILQGTADTQLPQSAADTLAELGKARKKAGPTEVGRLDGVTHALAEPGSAVSGKVAAAVADWIKKL